METTAIFGKLENGQFIPSNSSFHLRNMEHVVLFEVPQKNAASTAIDKGDFDFFASHEVDFAPKTREQLEELRQKRLATRGSMEIWMSDDFDAPLDEFEEYTADTDIQKYNINWAW